MNSNSSLNSLPTTEYWVYQTNIGYHGQAMVQAQLLTPSRLGKGKDNCFYYGPKGKEIKLKSAVQTKSYPSNLKLTYEVNPNHRAFDNYVETNGFNLYSEKLVNLLKEFQVNCLTLPVKMVDPEKKELKEMKYYLFQFLDEPVEAMDEQKSHWTGEDDRGVDRLVLKKEFDKKPLLLIDKLFVHLMRDDLKQEINKRGITGFGFLHPSKYKSGKYGFAPDFND